VLNFASFLRVSCTRYLSQPQVMTPELAVVKPLFRRHGEAR